jgi:SAM-dependent methyltransferase
LQHAEPRERDVTKPSPDKSFDLLAAQYERARPGYPEALYDRLVAYARLRPEARLLEIATGTGKGTLPLAQRGYRILCVEPGANLAAIARMQLAAFPEVEVQTVSFEDWEPASTPFDLAFVAQAMHWLHPEQRLPKLASALRPDGALAIFGNSGGLREGDLNAAVQAAYRLHAPEFAYNVDARSWYASPSGPVFDELHASAHFKDIDFDSFEWTRTLSAADYCSLIGTYSDHSTLPASQLKPLLAAVAQAIHAHGGHAVIEHKTGLFLARRK